MPQTVCSLLRDDWSSQCHCREDLRHLCVCSVDPPGCKDIDDALHVRSSILTMSAICRARHKFTRDQAKSMHLALASVF